MLNSWSLHAHMLVPSSKCHYIESGTIEDDMSLLMEKMFNSALLEELAVELSAQLVNLDIKISLHTWYCKGQLYGEKHYGHTLSQKRPQKSRFQNLTNMYIHTDTVYSFKKISYKNEIFIQLLLGIFCYCAVGSSDFDKIFENCFASCSFGLAKDI